jgi:hypothetical protein
MSTAHDGTTGGRPGGGAWDAPRSTHGREHER